MRESIDGEISDPAASCPADSPAAMRSALTWTPIRAAHELRATGAGRRGRIRVTEAGNRSGRAVGKGDASVRLVMSGNCCATASQILR